MLGICVRRPAAAQIEAVHKTASATAEHVGIKGGIDAARVMANGDYVGEGYGIPTAGTIEAIRLAARHEGLLLDPVYTGKAMAGLIDLCRQGFFAKARTWSSCTPAAPPRCSPTKDIPPAQVDDAEAAWWLPDSDGARSAIRRGPDPAARRPRRPDIPDRGGMEAPLQRVGTSIRAAAGQASARAGRSDRRA